MKRYFFLFLFLILPILVWAIPPSNVNGRLIFLGKTSDSSKSVWLSVTTAGSFRLEAQGNQLIDQWTMSARGTKVSLSPIVSQGNGGTHFLINSENNRKLDSQNQKGGIIFPPLPSLPPGVITPPIYIPPVSVMPPIYIPPGQPPGSVTPPIYLPPGSVTPPIYIPPEQPPSTQLPPDVSNPISSNLASPESAQTSTNDSSEFNEVVPVTKGRQLVEENKWNIWSDNKFYSNTDDRFDLDSKGTTTNFSVGADRQMTDKLVTGLLISRMGYNISAINDSLINRASGFSAGPYFGYLISPKWATDGSLLLGQLKNNNKISTLDSSYTSDLCSGTLHATGLYQFNQFQLRPQPMVSYSHYHDAAYQFDGVFNNRLITVNRDSQTYNFGFAELKIEGNYTFETKQGAFIQPYITPGIDYVFAQPNDGQVLTGNLSLATISPTTETLTMGMRTLISKVLLLDVSGAYLSFGQSGLSVWEGRLFLSYSFA